MRSLQWIIALALVPVMLAGCTKVKTTPTGDQTVVPEAKVTAEQLLDEYKKNQIGADQKYKDKPIQLTGKVSGVGKLPLAGYYVGIGTAHEDETFDIMCVLDKDDKSAEEKAGKLKVGDTVTLVGRCEGKAGGFALYFRYCFFPK